MTADVFRRLLRAAPFKPFRVVMEGGERHEVRHAELAGLTLSKLFVTPLTPTGRLCASAKELSLANVTAVELIV